MEPRQVKASDRKRIGIIFLEWEREHLDRVRELMRAIPNDDPVYNRDELALLIATNDAVKTILIENDGKIVGFVAYEFRTSQSGKELSVLAGCAYLRGLSLTTLLDGKMSEIAKENECESIMFETARPGLVETAINLGWEPSAITLRKRINGEHV